MGNEGSRLKGLVIEKTAVEANDFWALHNAEMPTTTNEEGRQYLSIFQGEPVVNGQLWVSQYPLERAIKNFMIYRHPYILKYVTTWEQGGQKHLATERVRPLEAVMAMQSDLQVCLGLRTILCSLIFLTEKAMARHLNVSIQSIYVTDNGSWRLAGFEYVWKNREVTKTLLERAKAFRYQNAIDPDESKDENMTAIEQYAFGTLCEDILSKCTKALDTHTATPHVQEFREYCATHLKHKNALMRPKLSAILLHPYFNHEFVLIHSFLFELPLKSIEEKQDFFSGLIDRLSYFDEEVVGAQLARDLLSRMVLLDPTAQLCVTPYVLKTKSDHASALFSPPTYKKHLLPHILMMFRLRDAQIRLILLEYFIEFVRLLSEDEMKEYILPHLLAGMNDTNDVLVAKTLRCLADLVPILGAGTVIGGQRSRLFSDGRPQAAIPDSTSHWVEPRSITPVMNNSGDMDFVVSASPLPDNVDLSGSSSSLRGDTLVEIELPTRLSPDGGEDEKLSVITDGHTSSQKSTSIRSVIDDEDDENIITNTEFNSSSSYPISTSTNRISVIKVDVTVPEYVPNEFEEEHESGWSDWEPDELPNSTATDTNETLTPTKLAKNKDFDTQSNTESLKQAGSASSFITLPSQLSLTESYRTAASTGSSGHSIKSYQKSVSINDDLNNFDIQVQVLPPTQGERNSEFDFFKDMEPIIDTNVSSAKLLTFQSSSDTKLNSSLLSEVVAIDSNRFAPIVPNSDANALLAVPLNDGDGWNVSDVEDDDDDPIL